MSNLIFPKVMRLCELKDNSDFGFWIADLVHIQAMTPTYNHIINRIELIINALIRFNSGNSMTFSASSCIFHFGSCKGRCLLTDV
jgi:hypothetical protein